MKTVQDYKQLGLVFIKGDYINTFYGKKENPLNRSGVKYCNNSIHNDEKFAVEFAWRNNDGAKPEYMGDKEIELINGKLKLTSKLNAFDNEDWSILGAQSDIVKWRPVVLQSDATKFTIKEEQPSLTMTVNIEGRDYLIASHTPAVQPKEDKPMKPVYTAEMHAKGEFPPVDSKVKVCIKSAGFDVDEQDLKFEGKAAIVKAAFSNTESEKIVAVENEDGNCYCYIIECIKPIIKTIKVNGFDVPAPMSEAPMIGDKYFTPQTGYEVFYCKNSWRGDKFDSRFLSRGLIHSTESAAVAHAKAMIGTDPNA